MFVILIGTLSTVVLVLEVQCVGNSMGCSLHFIELCLSAFARTELSKTEKKVIYIYFRQMFALVCSFMLVTVAVYQLCQI